LGHAPDASKPVFVFSSKAFVELHSALNHSSRIRCALTNSCGEPTKELNRI
jgi:hypothetical protein